MSEKKDNLTDVVEGLINADNPERKLEEKIEQQVINDEGATITLGEDGQPK